MRSLTLCALLAVARHAAADTCPVVDNNQESWMQEPTSKKCYQLQTYYGQSRRPHFFEQQQCAIVCKEKKAALPCVQSNAENAFLSSIPDELTATTGKWEEEAHAPVWLGLFQNRTAKELAERSSSMPAAALGWQSSVKGCNVSLTTSYSVNNYCRDGRNEQLLRRCQRRTGDSASAFVPTQGFLTDDYNGKDEDCAMTHLSSDWSPNGPNQWHDALCKSEEMLCICQFNVTTTAAYFEYNDFSSAEGTYESEGLWVHFISLWIWLLGVAIFVPIAMFCRMRSMGKAPFNGQPVGPVSTVGGTTTASPVPAMVAVNAVAVAPMQTITVQCPPDGKVGSSIQIDVNGQTLQLTVPPGVEPGQQFQAQVPAPPVAAAVGALGSVAMAQPMGTMQGLMDGQAHADPGGLYAADSIHIRQKFEFIELCGIESKNKYDVRIGGPQGQQTMYIREESECCERICCAQNRHLVLYVHQGHDRTGNVIGQIHRSFGLPNCCCLRPKLIITDGEGKQLGTLEDPCKCCVMNQELFGNDGNQLFGVQGGMCQLGMCCPCLATVEFSVTDPAGLEVGGISKIFGGCNEIMTGCNQFECKFPQGSEPQDKMLLLGATMGLDMSYFERKKGDN